MDPMPYHILRVQREDAGEAAFAYAETARIDRFNWNCAYQPLSLAQLCYLPKQGLAVRLWSYEENPVSTHEGDDAPVHLDSCLEFFVNPFPEASNWYLNFECNHIGRCTSCSACPAIGLPLRKRARRIHDHLFFRHGRTGSILGRHLPHSQPDL
jgi:hypothetical protein